MTQIKWLLVGAGDIASKRVAPALAGAKDSTLAAVCDLRREQAEKLAGQVKASEIYTDFDKALAAPVDAVYLATPVALHVPQAIQALEAGKHVLVEKPLGLNAVDCRRAMEAARKSGKTAGCAYFRRLFPRYLETKKMLAAGEFGQVVLVRLVYFSWFAPAPDDPKYWRVVRAKSGGGPLSDMGTHMFDVLIGLFGLPRSVYARCANQVHQWDVEDSAVILMTLNNGALVTASFNWNSKTWRHEFEIAGTKAKIDWLPYDTGPATKTVGRETSNLDLPPASNVHLPLVEDFIRAIQEKRPFACDLAEAAKTNVLLDAVYQSARDNREIVLEEIE